MVLHPGLEGAELRAALREDFSPDQTLGYDQARDALFRHLNSTRGELRGVYTGYTVVLDPSEDPSSDAFDKGFHTEHTWPQSKGAGSEPAKSDMHALFPARGNVNSSRSNVPFADIADTQTDKWYRLSEVLKTVPTANIEEYSERDGIHPDPSYDGRFEPREDHKGNAARAALYFYLMYDGAAEAADPDYLDVQLKTLLAWHDADPVSQNEYDRSQWIATRQGTANPFVVDTTALRRAFEDFSVEEIDAAQTGPLVISEIMPDPDDVPDEDGEWFEVYNPGDADVNMDGWSISDSDNDDAVITEAVVVPAGGFAVFCKNDNEDENGGIACDYDFVSDSATRNFFIANGDDELILRDGEGNEIDRVEYNRNADWPDEVGASMVYLDEPQADNNTPVSWDNATTREGRYDDPGTDLGSPGVNGTGQVLPVELIAFDARRDGRAVRLTWATASETDNAGFHVERAVGSAAFRPVGFVEGAGTTARQRTYRHVDENVPFTANRVRYRLRQVDHDGTSARSHVVKIAFGAPEALTLRAPFPNPTTRQATIRYALDRSAVVQLSVYDAAGRHIATLANGPQPAGRLEVTLDASQLASGLYFIRLATRSEVRTRAVTVVQ
jgi:hypothetical protein